jgi:hypothetical protein
MSRAILRGGNRGARNGARGKMGLWQSTAMGAAAALAIMSPAKAECRFIPYSFFPDRNDSVEIRVTTDAGQGCGMAFKEGPGYRFTGASIIKAPPHGVLAKTGPTKFLYLPFKGYRGEDSYAIRICAVVQGRSGCSLLTYVVEVR